MSALAEDNEDVSIPDDLESPRAKLLYLYLVVRDGATADDACDALGIDKGSMLAVTSTLRERGHVERRDGRFAPC